MVRSRDFDEQSKTNHESLTLQKVAVRGNSAAATAVLLILASS